MDWRNIAIILLIITIIILFLEVFYIIEVIPPFGIPVDHGI